MNLSKSTLTILQNFAAINPNIFFKEGEQLQTVDEFSQVLGKATITDTITDEFGIYDLNEFLSTLSLFSGPELEVGEYRNDQVVSIKSVSQSSSARYVCAAPTIMTLPPEKGIPMDNIKIKFTLCGETFANLKKAATTMKFDVMTISNEAGVANINVKDAKGTTSNAYSVELPGVEAEVSSYYIELPFKILKLLPGNYEIEVDTVKGVSHWKSVDFPVEYWIALAKTSKFED